MNLLIEIRINREEKTNGQITINFPVPFSQLNYTLTCSWANYENTNNYCTIRQRNYSSCLVGASYIYQIGMVFTGE